MSKEETSLIHTWTPKIDALLNIIRENCNYYSKYHSVKYKYYKDRLKWFRIPIIILSALNAFIAVGLQNMVQQQNISITNSLLSLTTGILTSIELFLQIQKKMENELLSHKEYYILSLDILKVSSLDISKRNMDGRIYLDEKFNEFQKLIQNSNIVDIGYYVDIYEFEFSNRNSNPDNSSKSLNNIFLSIVSPTTHKIQKHKNELNQKVQEYSKKLIETPSSLDSPTTISQLERTISKKLNIKTQSFDLEEKMDIDDA